MDLGKTTFLIPSQPLGYPTPACYRISLLGRRLFYQQYQHIIMEIIGWIMVDVNKGSSSQSLINVDVHQMLGGMRGMLLKAYKSDLSDKMERLLSGVWIPIWLLHMDTNKIHRVKSSQELHNKVACCIEEIPEETAPKNSSSLATCFSSYQLFKLDEQDMRGTAGEARKNS